MSNSLYIATDIHFSYHPGDEILKGINFHLSESEIVALIGPNGAGKSTLLKLLSGLLKPSRGEIRFDNHPLDEINQRELARQVAYLPQEDEIHFPFTVGEIVMLGRWPHSGGAFFDSAADRKVAEHAMETIGISDWSGRPVNELSGGERARVLLAKAITTQPGCYLLDEPVSELDLKYRSEAYRLLRGLADSGAGVVVVVHDVGSVSRWADRLVLLSEGEIIADGPPDEVLNPTILSKAYGIPVKVIADGDDRAVFAIPDHDGQGAGK